MARGRKTGGRTKGTLDKRDSNCAFAMKDMQFDPKANLERIHAQIEKYTGMLADAKLLNPREFAEFLKIQTDVNKILMPYAHSKKPIEQINHNFEYDNQDIERARDNVKKILSRLKDDK